MSDHPDHARRSPLASTLRLARGWYGSAERRLAWGLTALVVLMTLAQIATALGVNAWTGAFFGALERRDQAAIGLQAWIFAGLDVFDQEPPPADNPLFRLKNVVLTPHFAGPTWDNQQARFRNAFDNCQRVARGEKPLWVIPELAD